MTATTASTREGRRPWTALRLPSPGQGFVHAGGDAFESTDPATGEVVATLASSSAADVDAIAVCGDID